MSVDYYYSSVAGNLEMKKNQQKIEMILDSKKIPYSKLDISADEDLKAKMRRIVGNATGLPPQLCNGEQYCGGFDAFEEAVECDELKKFLKLE